MGTQWPPGQVHACSLQYFPMLAYVLPCQELPWYCVLGSLCTITLQAIKLHPIVMETIAPSKGMCKAIIFN